MTSAPPIVFECRTSRLLALASLAVWLMALVALGLAGMPHWLYSLLLAGVSSIGAYSLIRLQRPPLRSLHWRADGSVGVVTRDTAAGGSASAEGELLGARTLGPLLVLRLAWAGGGKATLWLLPDNLDADVLRRLRVRVRTTDFSAAATLDAGPDSTL